MLPHHTTPMEVVLDISSFDGQLADHMLLTVQLGPLHPSHLPCRYVSSLSCDKSGTRTCISSSSHFATSNMIICFMTSLSSSTTSHVRSGAAVNMCSIPHFSSLSFKTSFCHLLQHQKTPCDTEGLHQPSQHTFASFAWAQHQQGHVGWSSLFSIQN